MKRHGGDVPKRVQEVVAVLAGLGTQYQPQQLPRPARTAAQAAEQLGIPVGAIANSLVFAADHEPLLVLTSGCHRADPLTLGALLGVGDMRPATPSEVRKWTHQPIGGVAPLGHPQPLRTLVDVELSQFPYVWCGAGNPRWVFCTSYAELLRITAGEAAEVGDLAPADNP